MNEVKKNGEQKLDSAFESLRGEFTEMPAASLESNLRNEFRKHQVKRRAYRNLAWMGSAVAVATAALVGFVLVHAREHQIPPQPAPVQQTKLEPQAPAPALTAVAQPVKAARSRRHVRQPARVHRQSTEDVDSGSGFMAIPYTGALSQAQQFDVYRVQMPRAAVARFGMPMNAQSFDSPATADVLVGNDGVARAIRFVR